MAKKKPVGEQPTLMDQLQAYSPPWEDKEEKKEDDTSLQSKLDAAMARIDKMEKDAAAFQQQSLIGRFQSSQQAVQPQEVKRASTEVDMENLPDPVVDKEAYSRELVKRINAANDAKLAMVQAEGQVEAERTQLANNLWVGFQKAHPEWAQHELLVEAAAQRVSQGMLGRGVNVVQLMKSAPEMFYSEVAGMLDQSYPQLKEEGSDDDTTDEGDSGGNRTAGVFGGTPGKQQAGGEKPPEEGSTMLRELAEIRYKAGIR